MGDDGGMGVVRVKPLGAGGGGGEASASGSESASVTVTKDSISVGGSTWRYPSHIIGPGTDNEALYDAFMPRRVAAFLGGTNVNIMAYGQTGSGKTHTVFGPPGIMARAAQGAYGHDVFPDYGLFPRALIEIFRKVQDMRSASPDTSYVLTASAAELSMNGNEDLLLKGKADRAKAGIWGVTGVVMDKVSVPPRLYGMTELVMQSPEDLLQIFEGIACRNVKATGMNDSSSRSHCFVFITLFAYDKATGAIRKSRFQFCDLAGSERLKDAHGGKTETMDMWQGMMTNYSLTLLSQAARALVSAQSAGKKTISFGAYLCDLLLLLQESMTGDAMTAIFVCLSQAPANTVHSRFALEFGEVFSKLRVRPKQVPLQPAEEFERRAKALLAEARAQLGKSGGKAGDKYTVIRRAQVRDAEHQLAVTALLKGSDA